MVSKVPKIIHPLAGEPIVYYTLNTALGLKPKRVIIVTGQDEDRIQGKILERFAKVKELEFVRQTKPLGTAHAVATTKKLLEKAETVLILNGDVPLVTIETIDDLISFHKRERNQATVLTAKLANPSGYGRILRGPTNTLLKIVEEKDASLREIQIKEVNSGIYIFEREALLTALALVQPINVKKEYYLTDTFEILRNQGYRVGAWMTHSSEELLGINTRVDLARVESVLQRWTLENLMLAGVTIPVPQSVYVEPNVRVGEDTVIHPGTIIKGNTVVGKDCVLGPNLYLEDSTFGDGVRAVASFIREATVADFVVIGPYAHLRPGTHLDTRAKVGNFTELKACQVGEESKVPHLTYVGDAEIGPRCNIGAGTITCNYDGVRKNRTVIDGDTFIGSNVNLVAPLKIGKNVLVAAGSTITRDIPDDTLAVARSYQIHKKRNGYR